MEGGPPYLSLIDANTLEGFMADQNMDPNIRDLKAWLEARPKLNNLVVVDQQLLERVVTAFEYTRILGKPDAGAFSLIEAAAAAYSAQRIAGLEMLDKFIDDIKIRAMEMKAAHEKQLEKSEAVKYLGYDHFDNFVLQTDAQFTKTILRLVPIAVQLEPMVNFKNDADFRLAFLDGTERMLRGLGEGTMAFDINTNELSLTKPIGRILSEEKQAVLRGFLEKRRPLTKKILEQFLSEKN